MTQTLEQRTQPKRTRGAPTADGEFVVFEHVCIFDEHEGDDGVYYDEALLSRIADNCNRRIRTTGDWCPIVLAHTREQEEKAGVNDDPPVLGLAGPFYVGDWVNSAGESVKAIFATFWIFSECEKIFLRNPRRSVEIWPEERPENRYFDPIAVLGAETPKRDLGMVYSRQRTGHEPMRHSIPGPFRYSKRSTVKYQADPPPVSTPGPNNTFIPGAGGKKKPQKNDKGAPSMPDGLLSPDALQQIVEALKPTIQSMVDASVVADPGAAELPPVPAAPAEDELPPPVDDAVDPAQMSDDDRLYMRGLGRKFMKYVKDDELDDSADAFVGSLDEEDKKHLSSYMKYMCDNEGAKQKYAERYAKSPIGGDDLTEKPADSSPSGSMNAAEMKAGEPEKYAKKIKSRHDELAIKYSKLHSDHVVLKQNYAKQEGELVALRKKERYSRRLNRLKDRESEGFCFDPEEELALTEDFNDDQFDRHVDQTIPTRYSKVSGDLLPVSRSRVIGGDDKSQKYAKVARDTVERYRKVGRSIDYRSVLNHLIEHEGQVDESKLFAGNGKH